MKPGCRPLQTARWNRGLHGNGRVKRGDASPWMLRKSLSSWACLQQPGLIIWLECVEKHRRLLSLLTMSLPEQTTAAVNVRTRRNFGKSNKLMTWRLIIHQFVTAYLNSFMHVTSLHCHQLIFSHNKNCINHTPTGTNVGLMWSLEQCWTENTEISLGCQSIIGVQGNVGEDH